jgi:hypothetical protein
MTHLDLNSLMLLAVALLNAFTAWLTHRNGKNIKIVEKATNSMKDQLVAAANKAGITEGRQQMTDEVAAKKDKAP